MATHVIVLQTKHELHTYGLFSKDHAQECSYGITNTRVVRVRSLRSSSHVDPNHCIPNTIRPLWTLLNKDENEAYLCSDYDAACAIANIAGYELAPLENWVDHRYVKAA